MSIKAPKRLLFSQSKTDLSTWLRKRYILSDNSYKSVLIVLIPNLLYVLVTRISTQPCSTVVLLVGT